MHQRDQATPPTIDGPWPHAWMVAATARNRIVNDREPVRQAPRATIGLIRLEELRFLLHLDSLPARLLQCRAGLRAGYDVTRLPGYAPGSCGPQGWCRFLGLCW